MRGGAELIIHKLRAWSCTARPDQALLQLDFRNAYNSVSRSQLLDSIQRKCPMFLPFAKAAYGQHNTLFGSGFSIASEEGEHQGCPCGALFFAAVVDPLTTLCHSTPGCWSHWYLDDGHIVGPRTQLASLLPQLEGEAAKLGLTLNRGKSNVWLPPGGSTQGDEFPGVPVVSPDGALRVLGSPLGPVAACKQWVQENVLDGLALALQRLECLGNPQAASLVLRQCLSGIKVNWILRTADPTTAVWTAQQTSPLFRQSWDVVVGTPSTDVQWELACLPVRLGGAGMQDPWHTVYAAQTASWLSAASASQELAPNVAPANLTPILECLATSAPCLGVPLLAAWTAGGHPDLTSLRGHGLLPKWKDQSSWAEELFGQRAKFWDAQVIARLRVLRKLQCAPNAGLWLTARPGTGGGPDFAAEEWQALLRFRVGADISLTNTCAGCHSAMDSLGDHAACCSATGLYKRHNRVRDCLLLLGREAGWNPELEVTGWNPEVEVSLPAPDPGGGRAHPRPADVLFRTAESRPLAVDVTVVHPLRPSKKIAVADDCAAASEAETAKVASEVAECHRAGWGFVPFGMEVTGGFGPKATSLFKRICRSISMKSGDPVAEVLSRSATLLSVALAKGRAEMLCRAFKPC